MVKDVWETVFTVNAIVGDEDFFPYRTLTITCECKWEAIKYLQICLDYISAKKNEKSSHTVYSVIFAVI